MSKRLIYIIGAGRSGTTLLDIVLGNNLNSISLGEVNRFFKRNGIPPKRAQDSPTYNFWNTINKDLQVSFREINFTELDQLFHNNEYHSKALKILFGKTDKLYQSALKEQYNRITNNIREGILIESSKYPLRALNISRHVHEEELKIDYIYLKKDPVAVVASFRKKNIEQPSKSFLSANIYYFLVNLLCQLVVIKLKKRNHSVITVKYKDFVDDTNETLNNIENQLRTDLNNLKDKIEKGDTLKTGVLFDGNRIRLKETLTLMPQKNTVRKNGEYYFTRIFNYIIYRE